jgi:hypothetical protein
MGKDKFESHKIRDPIHGFCCLSELERNIIDSPEFQRLRDIKQLWPVNLIYPGAVHTRFEHSIGVCHIAGQIVKNIGLSEEEQQTIRLTALLHDIGHGPFSHVSEDAVMELKADRNLKISEIYSNEREKQLEKSDDVKLKKHESVSIDTIKEILQRFQFHNVDEIINLIKKTGDTSFCQLDSIISGPLDADKMDYLLRDSYYCGVEYGKYDLKRLINSFSYKGKNYKREIIVEDDDVNAIEQFALARYYLYQQVTTHKTTFKAERLFSRAIKVGVLEGLPEVCKYYNGNASWIDIRDSDIFNWIKLYKGSDFSKVLDQLLNSRRIPKIIFEMNIEKLKKANSMTYKEIETLVSKELNLNDKSQVIACFHKDNDLIKEDKINQITTRKNKKLEFISKLLQVITESNIDKKKISKLSILISHDDWYLKYGSLEEKKKDKDQRYLKDKKLLSRIL